MEQARRHQCLVYNNASPKQLQAVAAAMQQKLQDNYRCLYLNSPVLLGDMRSFLIDAGVNVAEETDKGKLILSADTAISEDGNFDIDIMMQTLEGAIDQALIDGYKGLFATGDMTWEFGAKENFSKLLKYEWQLERLFHKRPELSGICLYDSDTLPPEIMRKGLLSHPLLFINQTLTRVNQFYTDSVPVAEQQAVSNFELDGAIVELLKV